MNNRNKITLLNKISTRQLPHEVSDIEEQREEEAEQIDHEEVVTEETTEDEEENDEELVEFQKGVNNKGGLCLWHAGHSYIKNNATSWRCRLRSCKATAIIKSNENDEAFRGKLGKQNHNHPAEPQRMTAEDIRGQIKQSVTNQPAAKRRRILSQARTNTTDEVFVRMGSDQALGEMMRRTKSKRFGRVNNRTPLQMEFGDELIMKDGETILIYDSRTRRPTDPDVIFVFSHPKLLDILRAKRRWSVDGTFRCAPAPFLQCLSIGAFVSPSKISICGHALLPSKKKKHYMEVFEAILAAVNQISPPTVISDFEKSLISAMEAVFTGTQYSGCLFHLSQALWRKWKKMKLDALNADQNIGHLVRETFRRILALALIPTNEIRRGFGLIIEQSPPQIVDFIIYFAQTYIGITNIELELGARAFEQGVHIHERRSIESTSSHQALQFGIPSPQPSLNSSIVTEDHLVHRWELPLVKQPSFPPQFWSINNRAATRLAKTNNSMEASHKQFAAELRCHPSMADFILAIHNDIDHQFDIFRSAHHQLQRPQQRQYAIKEGAIVAALEDADYETDQDLLELLTQLGLFMQNFISGLHDNGEESGDDGSSSEEEEASEDEDDVNVEGPDSE